MDSGVVKPVVSQPIQVCRNHVALELGQLDGILTERHVLWRERSLTPIAGNGMDELIGGFGAIELVIDLGTEVVGM